LEPIYKIIVLGEGKMSSDTTTLGVEEYTIESLPNETLWTNPAHPQQDFWSNVGNVVVDVPIGPKVRFEIEEYDFDSLVRELLKYEREFGLSSLEIFSQYIHGELDEEMEEWLDLFILYLGTGQVRQFSCP
jgi:hypothetical protein